MLTPRAAFPAALIAAAGLLLSSPALRAADTADGVDAAPQPAQVTAPPLPPEATAEEGSGTTSPEQPASGGGRSLLLPEISFIGTANGKLSTDQRDNERNRLQLTEGEIGIQSYVYPDVRADAFISLSDEENFKATLEEGYLTAEQLPLRFSGRIGKYFVPFGRTNQVHPHSWLYVRRPLALQNLVSQESLCGNGFNLSWLAPTGSNLFLQLDAGAYSASEEEEDEETSDSILVGPGANFNDKFYTARAWAGYGAPQVGELEAGASWMTGTAEPLALGPTLVSRDLQVTGLDLSYRRYGDDAKRLLCRAEYLWHRYQSDLGREVTPGYYALVNYRWSKYADFGMLYDWSGIPDSGGQHESALSAIFTRQFTEQTYARLQFSHGNRPGDSDYDEALLELVWGVGPHTHKLE